MIVSDCRVFAGVLLVASSCAYADVLSVCEVGGGGQYDSIQAAIESASDGDTLEVCGGTYYENLDMMGKSIAIIGELDAEGRPLTVIDGAASGSVLTCASGEDESTRIENLILQNGFAAQGAGMRNVNSSPTVVNCWFLDNEIEPGNYRTNLGGGMYNENSSPIVTGCLFQGNKGIYGGGGMANENNSSPTITDSRFVSNSNFLTPGGGGLWIRGGSTLIEGCEFIGNWTSEYGSVGGAMNISIGEGIVVRDTRFEGNRAPTGGAVAATYNLGNTFENCHFVENESDYMGGALSLSLDNPDSESGVLIDNCSFARNTAGSSGGAISFSSMSEFSVVRNSDFEGNTAGGYEIFSVEGGGALHFVNESTPTIEDSSFRGNTAGQGGAMVSIGSSPVFIGCEMVENEAGAFFGGAMTNWRQDQTGKDSFPVLQDCVIENNLAEQYCGGIWSADGSRPTLAGTTVCHNTPMQINRPDWIDEGGNTICPDCASDLTGDGMVSGADLALLLASWGECEDGHDCPADLNSDWRVDGGDLGILLGDWGSCS